MVYGRLPYTSNSYHKIVICDIKIKTTVIEKRLT